MKLRTLILIPVLETRPPILRSPESVEHLAFCTASLSPRRPPRVSLPRSHIGGDFQILSASVVIQSAGVTTHYYSVFTFNSKRRRLRVVAPRSVSLQGKIQQMKYESVSENHTIEDGHTHFPRLASPRTQRFSRAFAYFMRSTIPMEKTFFCVFF